MPENQLIGSRDCNNQLINARTPKVINLQQPFGGVEKRDLFDWNADGCQDGDDNDDTGAGDVGNGNGESGREQPDDNNGAGAATRTLQLCHEAGC